MKKKKSNPQHLKILRHAWRLIYLLPMGSLVSLCLFICFLKYICTFIEYNIYPKQWNDKCTTFKWSQSECTHCIEAALTWGSRTFSAPQKPCMPPPNHHPTSIQETITSKMQCIPFCLNSLLQYDVWKVVLIVACYNSSFIFHWCLKIDYSFVKIRSQFFHSVDGL